MQIHKILLFPLVISLSSCSVFMAAHKQGVPVDELNNCKTRSCLIAKGAIPIATKKNKDGVIVEETYQVKKPTGSTVRAVMHGALDVATFGFWEVAGTPIEYSMDRKKCYAIKAKFHNDEEIKSIELG